MICIDFHLPKNLPAKQRQEIKRAATKTIRLIPRSSKRIMKKGRRYSLSISIVSDATMKKLNYQYRGKRRTTDVLSFSQLEGKSLPTSSPAIGDVLISLPQAKRQASEFGLALECELSRLVIHGVLHLFGYDHEKSAKEAKRMFRLQEKIFSQLFPDSLYRI